MDTIYPVVIPLNKTRLWWSAVCCTLFIVLGFFFVLIPQELKSPLIHNVFIIRILGFIALLLFGYFLGAIIPQLSNKQPGLVIDEKGITDHSTANSVGFIDWKDVTEVHRKSITGQKYIIIKVKNPEAYIERVSGIEKRSLKANLQLCGSPIAIPSTSLKCKFKQLEMLLTESFTKL